MSGNGSRLYFPVIRAGVPAPGPSGLPFASSAAASSLSPVLTRTPRPYQGRVRTGAKGMSWALRTRT